MLLAFSAVILIVLPTVFTRGNFTGQAVLNAGSLLLMVIGIALLFYFLTTLALFRLRRIRPDLPRPVKAFGYPIVPGLYLAATAGLMVVLLLKKPYFTWPGLIIVALGVPVYLFWRKGSTTAQA